MTSGYRGLAGEPSMLGPNGHPMLELLRASHLQAPRLGSPTLPEVGMCPPVCGRLAESELAEQQPTKLLTQEDLTPVSPGTGTLKC